MKKNEQTSFPCEVLSKNYWKYHFNSVLSKFYFFINIATNSIWINLLKILFVISHSFFTTIIIVKLSFLLAPTKKMCDKIVSNFVPNKERLFSFFHLFPTCFLQIPNMFLKFPMRSPRRLPIALILALIPYVLPKVSPTLLTYVGGPKG